MNQKELFATIANPMLAILTRLGVTDLPIYASYQKGENGRVLKAAYMYPVAEDPRGWQSHSSRQGNTSMVQNQQDTYQLQVFSPDDATNETEKTAIDYANILRAIIQSPQYVAELAKLNIGIQRPTGIRPTYFQNENDEYEANPNFDFVVSHKREIVLTVGEVDAIEYGIKGF